jgi:hypothetical protein
MAVRCRTVLGFVVAPLTPTIVLMPFAILAGIFGILFIAIALLFNVVFGYPIALIFGLPIYIFCQRRQWNSRVLYACGGFVPGLFGGGFAFLGFLQQAASHGPLNQYVWLVLLPFMAAGGILGGLSTICFWLIVRPDRSSVCLPSAKR